MDRIRVAPDQGRLLRLRPPCHLLIRDRPVKVIGRQVRRDASGVSVVYACETCTGLGALTVEPAHAAPTLTIVWQEGADEVRLLEADVEVFAE